MPLQPNALIHESSPYLLQHAYNPVHWYPWGDTALQKARDENKLLIISIGYAACHWCHVMEHESFEDEEVAALMNRWFVCIKVDREERPDIDQVYMNAVQIITGQGGWPLNCVALPDGSPLYGGTYFPKAQWINALTQIVHFSRENPDKTAEYAQNLTQAIRQTEIMRADDLSQIFNLKTLQQFFTPWRKELDFELGGYQRAPKFPLPTSFSYLLHHHSLTKEPDALTAVTTTLNKMALGGIYDQLGGGFARYSVDERWMVPHFEKMLYDNGQLLSLYSQAFQLTENPLYQRVVDETIQWLVREMQSPEKGFYASLDADSEGVEGKFYCWTYDELKNALQNSTKDWADYYSCTESGNWEHGMNILFVDEHIPQPSDYGDIKNRLLHIRNNRIRPSLDDKILTSWNALANRGLTDAYRAFAKEEYLLLAMENMDFLCSAMWREDGGLYRNYKGAKAGIPAFLDDYAFMVSALIGLYETSFREDYLHRALQLTEFCIAHFYDNESGFFFYTSDTDPALVARKMEITDNVIPASNSETALNLYRLGHYFSREDFIVTARKMAGAVTDRAFKSGLYFANWCKLMAWLAEEPYEVSICGPDAEKIRRELSKHYLPNILLSGSSDVSSLAILEGKLNAVYTHIYVCRNKCCSEPLLTVEDVLSKIAHW